MEMLQTPEFWLGLMKIIWINIILSGDNAVVIALAARSLPPEQQRQAVLFGSGAALVLRILLTVVAVQLLALPYLQIVGGALLLWIGVQLLSEHGDDEGEEKEYSCMMAAICTILIADLVMSLDNVIAVAAAANGNMVLLVLGLAISIPMVIFGSTMMIRLMERFPVVVTFGAALIGWVDGETMVSDKVLAPLVENAHWLHQAGPALGAALLLLLGHWLQKRHAQEEESGQDNGAKRATAAQRSSRRYASC